MIWEIGTIVKELVLPPVGLGWMLLVACWQVRRRPMLARRLIGATLAVALAMSLPIVSGWLVDRVRLPVDEREFARAQAIVVLGGGRNLVRDVDESVVDAHPNAFTLERVRVGALLAKSTGLPVLVSAGNPDNELPAEAEVMRRVLKVEFGVQARWVEDRSRNTAENADFSARILLPLGISRVILVTSGFHLRRARTVFRQAGFDVIPASAPPTGAAGSLEWQDFLPNARTLMRSHYAIHELAGIAYSLLRAVPTPSTTVGN